MNLSKNFTLAEFTTSQTASRRGINNAPSATVLDRLKNTAEQMEKVRKILGYPINISSGYRSPELNKAVGGASNSQHVLGEAVDFTCPKFGTPPIVIKKLLQYDLGFDQIINEYNSWTHISFKQSGNRKQALVIDSQGTRLFV